MTGDGSAITVTDPNSGESWEETSGKLERSGRRRRQQRDGRE
ncbi:MAG: hypothetical protein V8Q79_02245 [Christensenellales bacterium]